MTQPTDLERDGERYRKLLRMFVVTLEVNGMSLKTHPAPLRRVLIDAWIDANDTADIGEGA